MCSRKQISEQIAGSNEQEMTQKQLFRTTSILVGIFGTGAAFIAAEFGNVYVRAVAVVLAFLIGYFIALFQSGKLGEL